MNKFIRISALFLALLLVFSLFTACGQKTTTVVSESWEEESDFEEESSDANVESEDSSKDETASASSNSNKNSSNNASDKTSSGSGAGEAAGTLNLKGSTITLAGWDKGRKPDPASPTYKEETALIKTIEKKYNCKIAYKTIADSMEYYSAFTTATMAGTRFADIVAVPGDQGFPNAALNGYTHCLDDYFDWNSPQWINSLTNKALLLNGKHYYLAVSSSVLLNTPVAWFNPKVFDKFGEAVPHTYVKQNNWNWDTFRAVAKKLTRKDGTTQYYGLATPTVMHQANGADFITIDAKGTRKLNINSAAYIASIQYMYDLYNVDKVIPQENGLDLFKAGYVAMAIEASWILKDNDFQFTYMPIGPNVKDYCYTDAATLLWLVPITVKPGNLKAVTSILSDYTAVYKWRTTPRETLETMYDDEQTIETALDMHNRAMLSTYFTSYYPWSFRNIKWTDYGIKEQKSPQAFIQSVQSTGQAEIDVLWKKLNTMK